MKHEVFLCDGQKIRNNIHPDFVCVGADDTTFVRTNFPWLPKNAILLDQNFREHANYFVDLIDTYWKLEGSKYYEKREQRRKKVLKINGHRPFRQFITKEVKNRNGFTYVVFDGIAVRQFEDEEAQIGVNGFAYPEWVPKNILGVEKHIKKNEWKYVWQHEETEAKKMKRSKVPYDWAHDWATVDEMNLRRKDGAVYPRDRDFVPIKNWKDFGKRFEVTNV